MSKILSVFNGKTILLVCLLFLNLFVIKAQTLCPSTISTGGDNYHVGLFGTRCWIRENLRATVYSDGVAIPVARAYNDDVTNVALYGRLYDYYSATRTSVGDPLPDMDDIIQGVCPTGWHLPTSGDWNTLTSHEVNTLLSPDGWLEDIGESASDGFNMLPGGFYNSITGRYERMFASGYYWSSSVTTTIPLCAECHCNCPQLTVTDVNPNFCFSVRCVRDPEKPFLTTIAPPVSFNSNSATLAGNISFDGNAPVSDRGIVYSTNSDLTAGTVVSAGGTGVGDFSCSISGLTQGLTYYYAAYATNSVGTGYGDTISFTTLSAPDLGAIKINNTTMEVKVPVLRGTATTATIKAYTNADCTEGEVSTTATISNDTVSGILTALSNTTYYVRVTAENAYGKDTVTTISVYVNHVRFTMQPVAGGTFTMGCTSEQSDCGANESPEHEVTLSDFSMGETEVTQALWLAVVGSWPGTDPSYGSGDNYPAYYVSWDDVQSFITTLNSATGLNFRLPTEAEWEYAARGGNQSKGYKYSGSNTLADVAWYNGTSGASTHVVGTKNTNELGLYDMSGNVWEWCNDWYGSYVSSAQTNPQGPSSGSDRVRRGGSWDYNASSCRVANRGSNAPDSRNGDLGFRLALLPPALDLGAIKINNTTMEVKVPVLRGTATTATIKAYTNADCTEGEVSTTATIANDTVRGTLTGLLDTTYYVRVIAENAYGKDTATIISVYVSGVRFTMQPVAGGTFTMGCTSEQSDCGTNESPTHEVTLSDFSMGETEVTQALWRAVMGTNPSSFIGDNLPVEHVSWDDANSFVTTLNNATGLNFRLPTEAEWEYAARGGNQSKGYKYSGSNDIDDVAWYSGNSGSTTHAVATKIANELGLYDMSGNVFELCSDWYGDYGSSAQTNPQGPSSGTRRVLRGSGWFMIASSCRVAYRLDGTPSYKDSGIGFRLALVPPAPDLGAIKINNTTMEVKVPVLRGTATTATIKAYTNADCTEGEVSATATISNDTVSGTLTGLLVTTYYVRVVAENAYGKDTATTISVYVNSVRFTMQPVAGGTFYMGTQRTNPSGQNYDSDASDQEQPVHEVTLSDFSMGETEVTQALWFAVVRSWPGTAPSSTYGVGDNYPAYYVSWIDVQSFITTLNSATGLNFRLPTEAEWEYAARGGNQSKGYKYSGSNTLADVAWYEVYETHAVATKTDNELGLYDMNGNVWEWCSDWYGGYGSSAQTNPQGPSSGSNRVIRGGSSGNRASDCRVAVRSPITPDDRIGYLGFRLALVQ